MLATPTPPPSQACATLRRWKRVRNPSLLPRPLAASNVHAPPPSQAWAPPLPSLQDQPHAHVTGVGYTVEAEATGGDCKGPKPVAHRKADSTPRRHWPRHQGDGRPARLGTTTVEVEHGAMPSLDQ